jgi:hypothetical protein
MGWFNGAREEYVETVAAELVTATFEASAAALGVERACDVIIEQLFGLDDGRGAGLGFESGPRRAVVEGEAPVVSQGSQAPPARRDQGKTAPALG